MKKLTARQQSALRAGVTFAHGHISTLRSLHKLGLCDAPEVHPTPYEYKYRAKLTPAGWAAQDRGLDGGR